MKIKDIEFKPFITAAELDATVAKLAGEVSRDYRGRDLVVCPILTGAFIFAADLVRHLTVPAEVRFVRYSSYSGMSSTGTVDCAMPFGDELRGRDVLSRISYSRSAPSPIRSEGRRQSSRIPRKIRPSAPKAAADHPVMSGAAFLTERRMA